MKNFQHEPLKPDQLKKIKGGIEGGEDPPTNENDS